MWERKELGWACRLADMGWVLPLAGSVTLNKLFNFCVNFISHQSNGDFDAHLIESLCVALALGACHTILSCNH